ncbi:MAG: UbiA-like polyprenyltransferase [Pirellulaceae bacterium]
MWTRLRQILEMIRFSHTLFALPFALLAAVMAWTIPTREGEQMLFRGRDLLGILLCMVCARSAAMAFNRLADRQIDRENPRTARRHLPAGLLSVRSVGVFAGVAAAGFVAATALFLPNRLPLYLALPVLGFLFAYSYTKRFTAAAHCWLGTALMLAPVSTWIALRGEVVASDARDLIPALILGLAVLLWVTGFDIIYACQDVEFDLQAKLHSLPVWLGVPTALRIAALCHLAMVLVLLMLPLGDRMGGPPVDLGWLYWTSVMGVGGLLCYEHVLVRPDDLSRVNTAFFHVNAIISLGLFAVVAVDLLCL